LADEGAILVCGIYVDLNQIRAGESSTPETSRYTSAYDRICARQQRLRAPQGTTDSGPVDEAPDGWMCELTLDEGAPLDDPRWLTSASARRASDKGLLPVGLDDYLQLLDASGRIVREGKSGSIPSHLEPILDRLGIRREMWSALVTGYDEMFGHVVGAFTEVSQRGSTSGPALVPWPVPLCRGLHPLSDAVHRPVGRHDMAAERGLVIGSDFASCPPRFRDSSPTLPLTSVRRSAGGDEDRHFHTESSSRRSMFPRSR
jgi:hypothetical protein